MSKSLTPLLAIAISLSGASRAAADAAAGEPSIIKTLFHNDGEGFTPPAQNQPLQALLAKKPALTFFEACGVDTGEIARQLKRDPKLATAWAKFGWTPLH